VFVVQTWKALEVCFKILEININLMKFRRIFLSIKFLKTAACANVSEVYM
jgi:hypothetical protein